MKKNNQFLNKHVENKRQDRNYTFGSLILRNGVPQITLKLLKTKDKTRPHKKLTREEPLVTEIFAKKHSV